MDRDLDGLYALVLAAGGSRRLGTPKQLLRLDGETLLRRVLRRAAGICGTRVLTVLGCEWRRVLAGAGDALPFFVLNEDWSTGLSGSLTLGVRSLPEDCEAVLVLLADQPLVDAGDLERLARSWGGTPERIAASRYDGTLGVPAIFPRSFFPELLALEGDRGAKPVLARHAESLTPVDCEHARIDIDTPGDAAELGRADQDGG